MRNKKVCYKIMCLWKELAMVIVWAPCNFGNIFDFLLSIMCDSATSYKGCTFLFMKTPLNMHRGGDRPEATGWLT